MKLTRIKNPDAFFEFINTCNSNVWLKSPDGNCINLKSELSQVFSIARLFGLNEDWVGELNIEFDDPNELNKCLYLLVGGEI